MGGKTTGEARVSGRQHPQGRNGSEAAGRKLGLPQAAAGLAGRADHSRVRGATDKAPPRTRRPLRGGVAGAQPPLEGVRRDRRGSA